MTNCDHCSKEAAGEYVPANGGKDLIWKTTLYGCTKCDATSPEPFPGWEPPKIDHSNCDEEPCFGCKARGLQLEVGAARNDGIMTAKQHDRELGSYYDAVRQGIEPVSTRKKDIDAAVRLSNDTGVAFDGNKIQEQE